MTEPHDRNSPEVRAMLDRQKRLDQDVADADLQSRGYRKHPTTGKHTIPPLTVHDASTRGVMCNECLDLEGQDPNLYFRCPQGTACTACGKTSTR